ncbi:SRPBCC domain-containing protein [Hydrogenophaga sp.]|uniref:SRPBCC domain-containing protein n=1 Tax=Hydrogenophaga sp. TaxID=1904254 RepID=UPI0027175212|nr:SRPBCC domain-containing protein [Hydrogenophaga sp.]MDO9435976.1 SRPBCC domain-containing protein [Hydrogenophaga sp.]
MQFHSELLIHADADAVFDVLSDLALVAPMFPGASVAEPDAHGKYPGSLTISLGPKKLVFTGLVSASPGKDRRSGVIDGTANSNIRGTKMAVTLRYTLAPAAGSEARPATTVTMVSDAALSGLLADFAKVGGQAVANAVLDEFAVRLNAHFAAARTPMPPTGASSAPRLSLAGLLWRLVKTWLKPKRVV